MSFLKAAPYYKVSYYGKGPQENYPDRKEASQVGQYNTSPEKMGFLDYIVPGENGSRSECDWIAFRHPDTGTGLLITKEEKSFSCSALHYTASELDQASHTYDLPQREDGKDPIFVNIDHQLMGTFRITACRLSFSYSL